MPRFNQKAVWARVILQLATASLSHPLHDSRLV